MHADHYVVTDKQDNLIAEFKNIKELRRFLRSKHDAGENIALEYTVETRKKYAGLLIWTLASEPSGEY